MLITTIPEGGMNSAPLDVQHLLFELNNQTQKCEDLQRQVNALLQDRTATEKKAIELMQGLCENQRRHFEVEIATLKSIIKQNEAEKDYFEIVKSTILTRANKLEKDKEHLIDELHNSNRSLDELKDQMAQEKNQEIQELKDMNDNLRQRLNNFYEENKKLSQEVNAHEEHRLDLDRQVEDLKKRISTNEEANCNDMQNLYKELEDVKQQKAKLRCSYMELERQNMRLKTGMIEDGEKVEVTRLKDDLFQSQESCERVKRQLEETKADIENVHHVLDRYKSENEILRQDNGELKDKNTENSNRLKQAEKLASSCKAECETLKGVCKDLDSQCEDYQKLHRKYKGQNESLLDENREMNLRVRKLQLDLDRCIVRLEKQKKEKEKLESNLKYWQDEVTATEKDYTVELRNLGRMIASEKGVSLDCMNQIEELRTAKRELETKLHLNELSLEEAKKDKGLLEQEKTLFEEKMTARIAELDDKYKGSAMETGRRLHEAIVLGEEFQKEAKRLREENEELRSAALSHETDILKLQGSILQLQKLNTHFQNQLNHVPKQGCFICPDKFVPNRNALNLDRVEEVINEYRQKNADLSKMVFNLQSTLKTEREKTSAITKKPPQRLEIVGRDIAIIKKTPSINSDISTGLSFGEGKMRHNIPHRWTKHYVARRIKCMACMEDLPLTSHYAKCEACKTTVHHRCAENLNNTCGLPMLYSDRFYEEEKRLRDSMREDKMRGWVKLWRGDTNAWVDAWASLEHGVVSFHRRGLDGSDSHRYEPIAKIDLKACIWKIHLKSNVGHHQDEANNFEVPNNELPYVIEIKINGSESHGPQQYYMVMPDLISKQRWLAAFQKAIPDPIAISNADNF